MDEVKAWIDSILGTGYRYSMGVWAESAQTADAMYCVLRSEGGPMPNVDDRYPRYRVILLGRRAARQDADALMAGANLLIQAALSSALPCGAAHIRVSEPMGPGYTSENRAWVQMTLQVTL